jgi:hypothetical protein
MSFELKGLKKALLSTFGNRGTEIDKMRVIFDERFKQDTVKHEQWKAFLQKSEIDFPGDFNAVIEKIERFIVPIFDVSLEQNYNYKWGCKEWEWLKI